jgi:antitoxin StbD
MITLKQAVYAEVNVSMTELRSNLVGVIEASNLSPIAVLIRNKPAAYLISPIYYEEMLQKIEDLELNKIVNARAGGKTVQLRIEDL